MKKELLARTLLATRSLSLLRGLTAGRRQDLRILAYHRVFDVPDESVFPFDPELISASTAGFRAQIEHLARYFTPVTLADVLAALDQARPLPRRAVVITFDDGHADNYTHAFPILRSVGVPATIFISTGYVGGMDMFWFDRVAHMLYSTERDTLAFPGLERLLSLSGIASRRKASAMVLEQMMGLPDGVRRERIEWLAATLGVPARKCDPRWNGVLSWEQVGEMARAGIEFGSHAVTHPVLTRLDDASLERELVESRQVIAEKTGQAAETIAYPVGGPRAFDARVMAAARRAGYRLGLSYVSGTNNLKRLDRFAMRRLHVERYTSPAWFQSMLELPRLFS